MADDEDPHTRTEHPRYWKIPADPSNLPKFLETWGYDIEYRGVMRLIESPGINGKYCIGNLESRAGGFRIIITFAERRSEQWLECGKLRKVLEENNIPYEENPSREELISKLEEEASALASAMDMVKGESKEKREQEDSQ